MKSFKSYLLPAVITAIVLVGVVYFMTPQQKDTQESPAQQTNNQIPEEPTKITNYDECVAAGNPSLESYPARCTANGQTFTQDIGNELEMNDLIRSESPRPNQIVSSPLQINGKARGNWFFEASFPARLLDANGKELALKPIMTTEEWMTTNFVSYKGTLTFSKPATATGTLILKKDNPSGLPENDQELRIPVRFE
ncbi:Gmad2 immunoglobulin-like domain-containing protein [bacterium]|nr:MAG: Gmad2 immunoglobulin-like domain-containing protein [bacterium]